MSSDRADYPQASTSHMMKTTKRGRPYLKVPPSHSFSFSHHHFISQDTLDLFATLIVSLQLTTHKQYFRTFPNSFSTSVLLFSLLSSFSPLPQRRGCSELGFLEILSVQPWTRPKRQITNSDDHDHDHLLHDPRDGKGDVPAFHGRSSDRKCC